MADKMWAKEEDYDQQRIKRLMLGLNDGTNKEDIREMKTPFRMHKFREDAKKQHR